MLQSFCSRSSTGRPPSADAVTEPRANTALNENTAADDTQRPATPAASESNHVFSRRSDSLRLDDRMSSDDESSTLSSEAQDALSSHIIPDRSVTTTEIDNNNKYKQTIAGEEDGKYMKKIDDEMQVESYSEDEYEDNCDEDDEHDFDHVFESMRPIEERAEDGEELSVPIDSTTATGRSITSPLAIPTHNVFIGNK